MVAGNTYTITHNLNSMNIVSVIVQRDAAQGYALCDYYPAGGKDHGFGWKIVNANQVLVVLYNQPNDVDTTLDTYVEIYAA